VAIDTKLDGIRIQAHKDRDAVRVCTRSLDDITDRLPEVVDVVRRCRADRLILDGEDISLDSAGRPRPFQETAARTASRLDPAAPSTAVSPFFFDCLAADDDDLIYLPLADRLARLDSVVPGGSVVSRLVTSDVASAQSFFDAAIRAGQEGVVVKVLGSPYEAGRRGSGWVKVKPRQTLDLVVLGVEWGSGRRTGLLSNIHLGARDPSSGGFVMLGKTFKGMTDEMLAWQTERFTELAVSPDTIRDSYVVPVRPEQVVDVDFVGVQRSSRYAGGVALRFARVVRYRDDKPAGEADTIGTVRKLLPESEVRTQ
jgi:DNA ligase-1